MILLIFSIWCIYQLIISIIALRKYLSYRNPEDNVYLRMMQGIVILGGGMFIFGTSIAYLLMYCFVSCNTTNSMIVWTLIICLFIIINILPYLLIYQRLSGSTLADKNN